jgi:7-cyano-7-deazaguanine reductase
MFSFRNHACFHENTVNTIGKDLVQLLDPKFLEVKGEYLPRGGISIDPIFVYGRDQEWKDFARKRLLDFNCIQRTVSNR